MLLKTIHFKPSIKKDVIEVNYHSYYLQGTFLEIDIQQLTRAFTEYLYV